MNNPNSNAMNVAIVYTNYKGITAVRHIVPDNIYFGKSEWHPEPQWLLLAYDIDRKADRSFALKDIRAWFTE